MGNEIKSISLKGKIKYNIIGAIVFLSTIVIGTLSYAWTDLAKVNTGDPMTSTLWNNLVDKINDIGKRTDNIYSNGGNIGIGVSNPGAKLEVNGEIKANNLQVNGEIKASNIEISRGSFYIGGAKNTFYPVIFNNGVGTYDLRIFRKRVHEDSSWNGNIDLIIQGKSSNRGNLASWQKVLHYSTGNQTRCAKVGEFYKAGNVIVRLEGLATYHYEGKRIGNPTVYLTDYTNSLGEVAPVITTLENLNPLY